MNVLTKILIPKSTHLMLLHLGIDIDRSWEKQAGDICRAIVRCKDCPANDSCHTDIEFYKSVCLNFSPGFFDKLPKTDTH